MKKHKKLLIKGRVQKVGYRASTLEAALQNNISGNVKNTPDGNVKIDAEGEEEDLQKFITWCFKGPFWAKVTEIEEKEESLIGYDNFEIVR
ncbi:MAG: acylphosphatase [Bacteroidetes bacterium]|nr:MAG: acylphosphatase [Bacteroidota bacterium]